MSAVSCSTASSSGGCGIRFQSKTFASSVKTHSPNLIRIGTNSQSDRFCMHRLELVHGTRKVRGSSIRMALVDERQSTSNDVAEPPRILAYDLVQGALVKWRWKDDKSVPDTPTAVLLHGILGSGKNWGTFARRLAHEFPTWQFLLVDLRCHGDSASLKKRGPHSVATTASDVLKLVGQLRLTPRVLVGHSFGGKVVLSMVEQAAKPLPRPVRAWVLDATPGKVRAGGDGEDHPRELISFLRKLPKVVLSKREVLKALLHEGFSNDVAQWVITNLKPTGPSASSFSWTFDLDGIAELYQSYEDTNLWNFVENLPRGVHVNFLKAERSLHRWALKDLQRIHAAEELASEEGGGVEMHVLEDAGHWVHTDNPDGLFRILSSSFQVLRA
ncbi:Alpha/Beta hydrolase fold [Arabidopsis thaliana x Arabidopsis arenosa]|uniref:Alpha/Beta hydrolase fold n=1 Tax=Arabidopsis thaliana x Arabidopsis arenosa TaxID=1240361 RepID=A0A8T1Z177_9BRAS|nr:Alpha/Beta hydrolase fold [Arabidopsis thaliana x Arabidopsis arenosa]